MVRDEGGEEEEKGIGGEDSKKRKKKKKKRKVEIEDEDEFHFNPKFSSKLFRIKINPIQVKINYKIN